MDFKNEKLFYVMLSLIFIRSQTTHTHKSIRTFVRMAVGMSTTTTQRCDVKEICAYDCVSLQIS